MKNLNLRNVAHLLWWQVTTQKAYVGKAFLCAVLLIVLGMIVYVGDFKENCEYAVKCSLLLSIVFPSALTFTNFLACQKQYDLKNGMNVTAFEKYLSVWLTAVVNILVWMAVIGLLSLGVIWSIGNFFYQMPMNHFLKETFEGFSRISLMGLLTLVTMVVLFTTVWHLKTSQRYRVPVLAVLLAVCPLAIFPSLLMENSQSCFHALFGWVYGILSVFYFLWTYFIFKKVLQGYK